MNIRRIIALTVASAAVMPVVVSAVTDAAFTPVCITVEAGRGWNWVANQFNPTITGAAREAFVWRIWAYEDNSAVLTAGELVCIDPRDPALQPSTTTTVATTTTVRPTTTTLAPPTTVRPTTVPPTTMSMPPTTVPAGGFPQAPMATIPSNFSTGQYLHSAEIPARTDNEPSGNFRTVCMPSHYAHHDPIVNPGGTSSHLHLFFGNTAANNYSTYETLRTSGNSTCEGGPLNRTGYWMPAMFDGAGRVVPPNLILVYYKTGASGGGFTFLELQQYITDAQPLPPGLRMIAGGVGYGHVTWKCGDNSNQGTTIPNSCTPGPDGTLLIAQVSFPDCWDGHNLDSVDHRSHLAYRSYGNNGRYVCPASHPINIPSITEGFFWNGPASTDIGTWFLSSDMGAPRGSTMHADWFGAWDTTISDRWFNNCDGGGDPRNGPFTHMRNSNNGNLCDGQQLSSAAYVGAIQGTARLTGYIPNAPQ